MNQQPVGVIVGNSFSSGFAAELSLEEEVVSRQVVLRRWPVADLEMQA